MLYTREKCPYCSWSEFTSDESVGMTPCEYCGSTGYIYTPFEPKPDESRLQTRDTIHQINLETAKHMRELAHTTEGKFTPEEMGDISWAGEYAKLEAQRDLTASIMEAEKKQCQMCVEDLKCQLRESEAECQQRIEGVLKELRGGMAIEYKKSLDESKASPFPSDRLNAEHKLLWLGHANAYSEVISELDRLQALKKEVKR